jgi:L-serine dehydratase
MQRISVFQMLKIGVGPSSSHTMGPWQAALTFLRTLGDQVDDVTAVTVDLYGSLAKTGKGHGTGMAVMMGLRGENPVTCDTSTITHKTATIRQTHSLHRKISVEAP